MPSLGIEVNGTMPALIQDAGNALSQSLIQTGKTIETALINSATFRQASELGDKLSQINPQSDAWPQQAAAITSQYPLAVQSGLAKQIVEPSAKAFAGYQAAKTAVIRTQGALDVAKLRGNGPLQPLYQGDSTAAQNNSPAPNLTNVNSSPIDVTSAQNGGIQSVLASGLGPMGAVAGAGVDAAQQAQPTDVVPPLTGADAVPPDAAMGMRQRASRPLQSYVNDFTKSYNDAINAHQKPQFNQSQIATLAARQKTADDRDAAAANPVEKVKSTLSDATGNLYREMTDGSFVYPDGSKHLAAPAGLTRVAGAHEQQRLDQAASKQVQMQAKDAKTDVVKAATAEYDDAAKDFSTNNTLLQKLQSDRDALVNKGADADALAVANQKLIEQKARTQTAKDRQDKALQGKKAALLSLPVLTPEQASKLPPGTNFRGTNGKTYVQP